MSWEVSNQQKQKYQYHQSLINNCLIAQILKRNQNLPRCLISIKFAAHTNYLKNIIKPYVDKLEVNKFNHEWGSLYLKRQGTMMAFFLVRLLEKYVQDLVGTSEA